MPLETHDGRRPEPVGDFSWSERFRFEELLTTIFAAFIHVPTNEIDQKINHALHSIGRFLNTDRCNLFQFDEQTNRYVSTHSWARQGVPPLPQGIKDTEAPWMSSQLLNLQIVHFRCPEELPEEADIDRALAWKYGVKSMLMFPLADSQMVFGGLMLDQVSAERSWGEELILRLKIVADVLSSLLIKRRSDEKLQQAFLEINQLKDRIESERNYLREEIQQEHNFKNIIGRSPALMQAIHQVEQVGPTDTTVLILGETGVGKELFARAIHQKSPRSHAPLIKVNCASLPANLIESELLGHEKGAFTGAHSRRKGRFELADGATLFLDEIGELPLETQGKLLTVLEYGEFERVGGASTITVDVRIIAATNRDLEKAIREGRFRSDLWYRLNVFSITVPPLRQRAADIPLLANWMLNKFCKRLGKQVDKIPLKTIRELEAYSWPGNVRELQNVIERSVINANGDRLYLAEKLNLSLPDPVSSQPHLPMASTKTLSEIEKDYIVSILKKTRWKIEGSRGAAVLLGLPPSTIRSRIKKHGILRPW
ncbi:MAG: sigma 54-interacting transcriptional regulator [Thermodesulfobacteriota bacterium]